MPLICYKPQTFSPEKSALIAKANLVINEYNEKGYSLTLRQLYYVFVANDMFPDAWKYRNAGNNKWVADPNGTKNAQPNYDKLGDLISDARMAGLVDWEAIVDRSRSSYANRHWLRASQALEGRMREYAIDKWAKQPNYVECWVEKEALQDVLQQACSPLDVRFFACKGYTSQSAMWEASQRLLEKIADGKQVHIIHLGDHDPSGIDMTRDIMERLETFVGHFTMDEDDELSPRQRFSKAHVDRLIELSYEERLAGTNESVNVHRIALNMNQIKEYQPPPNWAKINDPRAKRYIAEYGDESWELDALRPDLLVKLITDKVKTFRVEAIWDEAVKEEKRGRETLQMMCTYFPEVVGFLRERRKQDKSRVICQGCGATEDNPRCLCKDNDGAPIQLGPGEN